MPEGQHRAAVALSLSPTCHHPLKHLSSVPIFWGAHFYSPPFSQFLEGLSSKLPFLIPFPQSFLFPQASPF